MWYIVMLVLGSMMVLDIPTLNGRLCLVRDYILISIVIALCNCEL